MWEGCHCRAVFKNKMILVENLGSAEKQVGKGKAGAAFSSGVTSRLLSQAGHR